MTRELGVLSDNVSKNAFESDIENFCRANSFDEGWLKDNIYYIRDTEYLDNDNIYYKNNIIKNNMCFNRSFFNSCKKADYTKGETDLIQTLLCLDNVNLEGVVSNKDCMRCINLLYSRGFRIVYDSGCVKLIKDCCIYDVGATVRQVRSILLYSRLLIES